MGHPEHSEVGTANNAALKFLRERGVFEPSGVSRLIEGFNLGQDRYSTSLIPTGGERPIGLFVARSLSDLDEINEEKGISWITAAVAAHPELGLNTQTFSTLCSLSNRESCVATEFDGRSEIFDGGYWRKPEGKSTAELLRDRVGISIFGSARHPVDPSVVEGLSFLNSRFPEWLAFFNGAGPGSMQQVGQRLNGEAVLVGVSTRFVGTGEETYHSEYPLHLLLKEHNTRQGILTRVATMSIVLPGGYGTHEEVGRQLDYIATHQGIPAPMILVDGDFAEEVKAVTAGIVKSGRGEPLPHELIVHCSDADQMTQVATDFLDNPIAFWASLRDRGLFSPEQMRIILSNIKIYEEDKPGLVLPRGIMEKAYQYAGLPISE